MPQFTYRAIGRDGKSQDGVIDAQGMELASRQLRAQGLTLLKLEPGAAGASVKSSGRPPGRQDILSMTSELAVLLRAGLPLDRALKVLIDMAAQPAMNQLLNDLLSDVKGGRSLSQALAPHEELFGTFYISMVRAGEASGKLSEVLDRLVEYLENAKANRDSVVSALIYPAILLVVSVLSIIVMLGFVVPQFESLFEDMGESLPALTRAVIAGGDFIAAWWLVLLLVVVGGGIYLRNWAASDAGRETLDRRLLFE